MEIEVTYDDNAQVFRHFGHTEQFKIYEVEDNKIVNSRILTSNGEGHSALANLLENENVDKIVCGGIGGCAVRALNEAGIEIFAGISGNADKAVEDLLSGNLVQTSEANCSHHHGDHSHGHHHGEGHSCGHSCH